MAAHENNRTNGCPANNLPPVPRVRAAGWLAVLVVMTPCLRNQAQEDQIYYPRTAPFFPYSSPDPVKYNLKWGKLTARFNGGVNVEFNDNVNLSQNHPHADLSIGPTLGVGFLYPITKNNVLQFDMGIGYRWYLNSPGISSISVAPNSHLDHTVIIDDVRINFHDTFSVQVDPLLRSEISGGPTGNLVNFRRIHNVTGVAADWNPVRQWGFTAGYDYGIDRSLSDDFTSLDLDTHTFNAGAQYIVSPRWTVGFGGSYSFTEYTEKIQNGGDSFTLGPNVTWKPSKYITFNASVGYSISTFDTTGTIADRENFTGITYQVAARHMINRRMSHDVRFGYSVGQGLGSNFTQSHVLQYGLRTQLSAAVTLNTTFAYETSTSSGIGGETSDRYLLSIGTGYQLTRRWAMGLAYTFAWKDSDQVGRDYTQNRVTIDLNRQF